MPGEKAAAGGGKTWAEILVAAHYSEIHFGILSVAKLTTCWNKNQYSLKK